MFVLSHSKQVSAQDTKTYGKAIGKTMHVRSSGLKFWGTLRELHTHSFQLFTQMSTYEGENLETTLMSNNGDPPDTKIKYGIAM